METNLMRVTLLYCPDTKSLIIVSYNDTIYYQLSYSIARDHSGANKGP